jgi:hypothetical protein
MGTNDACRHTTQEYADSPEHGEHTCQAWQEWGNHSLLRGTHQDCQQTTSHAKPLLELLALGKALGTLT